MLLVLAERAGKLVSKNELLDLVWAGVVVEENNLQVQVSALRKLLGPDVIATIPGRGYRLTLMPDDAAAQRAESEPAPARSPTPHDGAIEAPALYGRADDVDALRDLILHHPLVTLVGPGGIGKTRLAQAIAHDLRNDFGNNVKIVELASLADPTLVAATVARALGLVGDADAALSLSVRALAGQRLLLVLDNCEHLLDDVALVVAALRKGAPEVHILATSQEVLRHPDEHVYRLGALAVPADLSLQSAGDAGAVQLFIARAQAVEPRLRLSEENFCAIVEICRRLDGIPLAIELAAARVLLLGVEGVRERLDERFRLLTAGSRLALRRHQTLRAALEWSYGLLSATEQTVFDRIGAFAGSFSLECAQALAADDQSDEWSVLDHLGALVDKSLVAVEDGANARYRMLETTRAFALERLAASGATSKVMHRHAEVMLYQFERYYDEVLQGAPSVKVVGKITPDLDNLRGALNWAGGKGGDRRIAIALFGAAVAGHGYFFYVSVKPREWIEMLRPLIDASIPKADAARFWLGCANWGATHLPVAAIDDARRAITVYRELGDRLGECRAWSSLAYSLQSTGQFDEGERAVREVLRLRDPAWSPWLRALVDNIAALVLQGVGKLDEARQHAVAMLAASREVSVDVDVCVALTILMELDIATGKVGEAAAAADDMLAHHPAIWAATETGRSLRTAATALMGVQRLDEAEPLYREALARSRRNYGNGAFLFHDVAMFVAMRARLDDAARLVAYADHLHSTDGLRPRLVARMLRDRLHAQLATEFAPDSLSRLYDEGRRLSDDDASTLAFSPPAAKG